MFKEKIWWPFAKQHYQRIILIIVLGLLTSYFTLLLPLSIGKYMEIISGGGNGKTKALQLLGINLPSDLMLFFIFFLSILLLKFFSSWMQQYLSALIGEAFAASLRKIVFTAQLSMKEKGAMQPPSLLAYTTESKVLQQLLIKGVTGLVKDVLFLVMSLYVLFSLNVQLSLAVVFSILLFWFVQRWHSRKHVAVYAEKRKMQGSLLNFVTRILTGDAVEKNSTKNTFEKKATKLKLALKNYCLKKTMHRALAPFMLYCMLAFIMVLIAIDVNRNELQKPDVIAYILLLMTMFPTIRNIIKVEYVWMQGELSAKKINKITNGSAEPNIADKQQDAVPVFTPVV